MAVEQPTRGVPRIRSVTAWQVDLPLVEGAFRWSGGTLTAFDSTVVRIETDLGVTGWGEVSPLGPAYLPAYAEGARAGIRHIAPHLLGLAATELTVVGDRMDAVLNGHPYAKSALDMACWDIFGRVTGLSATVLLGGRSVEAVPLYRAISKDDPASMADRVADYGRAGYRRFQLKIGGAPDEDVARVTTIAEALPPGTTLVADANKGWLVHEAARVVREIEHLDLYLEQPCRSYDECLSIRQRTNLPFVLDEIIDSFAMLARAHADDAMDMINIKISKVGGLSKARQMRDACAEFGIGVIIEDSCGGDIATAAVVHLAQSTPERILFASTDLNGYVTRSIGDGAPSRQGGTITASTDPGLGVEVDLAALGEPVFEIR